MFKENLQSEIIECIYQYSDDSIDDTIREYENEFENLPIDTINEPIKKFAYIFQAIVSNDLLNSPWLEHKNAKISIDAHFSVVAKLYRLLNDLILYYGKRSDND